MLPGNTENALYMETTGQEARRISLLLLTGSFFLRIFHRHAANENI
jgi:hypothetical protein